MKRSSSVSIQIPGKDEKGIEGFQKIIYKVSLIKKLFSEQDTLNVLLFSTGDFPNMDYKIILNNKADFCGMIDVDDLSSGYIAVSKYLDIIQKYYYDEDWW